MEIDITIEDARWDALSFDSLVEQAATAVLSRLGLDPDDCELSVLACDDARIAVLNADHRGKPQPTNVLSFPADFPNQLRDQVETFPLGDIVICAAIVELEAKAQDKELLHHWAHLTVHGLFHLLGYQHDDDMNATEMEKLEINTLERLGISNPYLLV